MDRIPMTREGYEKLKADLDRMQNVEMIEVAKRIAAARDLGDLSENAEYHAAREDQGMLQARIDALQGQAHPGLHRRQEQLAHRHRRLRRPVRRQGPRRRRGGRLELVGPGDEDYDNNKILTTSPIGQGLLGKKIGEVAEIQVPRGRCGIRSSRLHQPAGRERPRRRPWPAQGFDLGPPRSTNGK